MENFINLTIISFALIITLLNCQYGFRTHTRNKRTIFDISSFNLYKKEPNIIINAIGNAIKHSSTQLDKYDKEIRQLKKKLDKAKDSADKLITLAIEKVIPKGRTYSEKMDSLENEITALEDQLEKAKARS